MFATGWTVKSHIHYEAAFEDYLRTHQVPYVAVDEAKKSIFRDAKLKSFDFIAYAAAGDNCLIDIKGRRWATRKGNRKPTWENWATADDLDGLRQWQDVFGAGFVALLVFAYRIDEGGAAPPAEVVHEFRDRQYVFAGVPLDDYRINARVRSPKWGTVSLPVREFARYVRPIADWLR